MCPVFFLIFQALKFFSSHTPFPPADGRSAPVLRDSLEAVAGLAKVWKEAVQLWEGLGVPQRLQL